MAKSKETYSKKEKEKKRLKQLQDKKQKMDERKASKKSGVPLESMMAYLDENGNLTDTPPDPRKKHEYALEEIQIGVPKQGEGEVNEFKNGIVSYYNSEKGFGFINSVNSSERLFFHVSDVLQPLEENDRVQFLVARGPRGLNAVQVNKLEE